MLTKVFSGRIADDMLCFLELVAEKGHWNEIERSLKEFLDKVREFERDRCGVCADGG